jgi:hypothetical protein
MSSSKGVNALVAMIDPNGDGRVRRSSVDRPNALATKIRMRYGCLILPVAAKHARIW